MALRKTCTARKIPALPRAQRGFSLIEMLVVIGIVAMLGGLVLFMNINSYRSEAFRAEVGSLGVALQTARANALNNINQHKHGVAIAPGGYDGYVVFEGGTYGEDHSYDIHIPASYGVTFAAGAATEVVFDQLSGDAHYNGDGTGVITVVDPQRNMTATIVLNREGRIAW